MKLKKEIIAAYTKLICWFFLQKNAINKPIALTFNEVKTYHFLVITISICLNIKKIYFTFANGVNFLITWQLHEV